MYLSTQNRIGRLKPRVRDRPYPPVRDSFGKEAAKRADDRHSKGKLRE